MRKTAVLPFAVLMLITGLTLGALLGGMTLAQQDAPDCVPTVINYQGMLTDSVTGEPVPDGEYDFVFSIYDVSNGGEPLWGENQTVSVSGGVFNVMLGSVVPLSASLFEAYPRYLGIEVGEDEEMTPRQHLASVPYAFQAENACTLQGDPASAFLQVTGGTMTGPLAIDSLWAGGQEVINSQGEWVGDPPPGSITSVTVNTLAAGAAATAEYDSATGVLTLGIPQGAAGAKGDKGDTGDTGAAGPQGPEGPQGLPGADALSNITPITLASGTSSPYTVPEGKNLFITAVHLQDFSHELRVDGVPIATGPFNCTISGQYSLTLAQPIVVAGGQTISGFISVNGYMRDSTP